MPSPDEALPGRAARMPVPVSHFVNGHALLPPFPDDFEVVIFGMGCFWGAEERFWETEGVFTTAVGYAGGYTPNPTYEEICTGRTGHAEVVLVVYDPETVTFESLLKVFWEGHDPTQGMRQGNDFGNQYRSAAYWTTEAQREAIERSGEMFQAELHRAGYGEITTEIAPARNFYYAEPYHQQYVAMNPAAFCGLGGTGVSCPVGIARSELSTERTSGSS